jgi:hypothetical protein
MKVYARATRRGLRREEWTVDEVAAKACHR